MTSVIEGLSPYKVRDILGEGFALDLVNRVENRLGVDVIILPLTGPGYSLRLGQHDVVVLKATDRWFRSAFTLAHELGHLSAGARSGRRHADTRLEEHKANTFAAELLMPAEQIRSLDWTDPNPARISQHLWEMGVSTQALRTRLTYLQCHVASGVNEILQRSTPELIKASLPRAVASPEEITERMMLSAHRRFPSRLLTELRNAVDAGRAPRASLAWALGIPPEDDGDTAGSVDTVADLSPDLLDGLA